MYMYVCPKCAGKQFSASDKKGHEPCVYCGHRGTDLISGVKKSMNVDEVISQLENLRQHCEDWDESDSSDSIWKRDVKALDYAIEKLKEDKLNG